MITRERRLEILKKYNRSEKGKMVQRRYYQAHRDACIARCTTYNQSDAGREVVRRTNAKQTNYKRQWAKLHPEVGALNRAMRRARKLAGRTTEYHNGTKRFYKRAKELRQWFDVVVDHIIPLAKGGMHCASNLQIIYRRENCKKNDSLSYVPSVVFA